jgi:protocatechuate 3,4-dioxygenase beta subunit
MAHIKRVLRLSLLIALVVAAQSLIRVNAQTPDAKPKATAAITGRVTIGDKPAPGVIVAATVLNNQSLVAQGTSDAEGKYRINGLAAGQITVSAFAPTYVIPQNPIFGMGRVINLSTDETVEGIDFNLARGGVITGRVTDADGKPVIEARVNLTLVDDKGEPVRGTVARSVNFFMNSTDDRGIYRLYGLAAGRYKVSSGEEPGRSATPPVAGYYPKTYYPNVADPARASIVELTEGGEAKNIDIALGSQARTYSVSGRIIDADTNQPLPGVEFAFGAIQQSQAQSFVTGTYSPGTPTNSQGEFRLEGIMPGHYAITTNSNVFRTQAQTQPSVYSDPVTFEVNDSDVSNLEVKAHRGLSISGMVIVDGITDKNVLAAVSKLLVSAFVEPSTSGIQIFSGASTSPIAADGTFQLDGLRPGKVALNISGNLSTETKGFSISRIVHERITPNRQIELAPGQSVSGVRIYLAYGTGIVKGDVKVEGGTLPPDALLFVALQRDNQAARMSSAQVDARGHFVVTGVAAGTYDVVLQIISLGSGVNLPRGFPRTHRQTVTVNDGSESQVLFTLDLTPKEGP